MSTRCFLFLVLTMSLSAQGTRFEPLESFLACPDSEAVARAESLAASAIPSTAAIASTAPRPGAQVVRNVVGGGPDALVICPRDSGATLPRTCLLSPVAPRGLDAFTLRAAGAPWLEQGFALIAPLPRPSQPYLIPDAGWIVAVERTVGLSPRGRVLVLGSPYSEWSLSDASRYSHTLGALHVALRSDASAPDAALTPPWITHNWVVEYAPRLHPDHRRTLVKLGTEVISAGATFERHPDSDLDLRPAPSLRLARSTATIALALPSTKPARGEVRPNWAPLGRSGLLARSSGFIGSITFEGAGTTDFRVIQGPATPSESIELVIPVLGETTDAALLSEPPPAEIPTMIAIPESCRIEPLTWSPRVHALMTLRQRIRTGLPIKSLTAVRVST